MEKVFRRSGPSFGASGAYEVNEAFAPVPLAWAREFDADPDKLNPRGGAIALGHPLGATGGRYGLQTMCEGGGMANATSSSGSDALAAD